MKTFLEYYTEYSKVFKIFGVIPIRNFNPPYKTRPTKTAKIQKILVTVLYALFLIGLSSTFLVNKRFNNQISIISNYIQMIANALTLTMTLSWSIWKVKDHDLIIHQFIKIDEDLQNIGHKIDYVAEVKRNKKILLGHLSFLVIILVLDFYVSIVKFGTIQVWYWLVSATPVCIYSLGMYHALFIILGLKLRCSLINETVRENTNLSLTSKKVILLDAVPSGSDPDRETTKDNGKNEEAFDDIVSLMSDVCKLSSRIDKYFGPFFLIGFATLFAVTTIQTYYCYVIGMRMSHDVTSYSMWTIWTSINIVVLNLSLAIGITTVSENLASEMKKVLQNFSELQFNKLGVSFRDQKKVHNNHNRDSKICGTAKSKT